MSMQSARDFLARLRDDPALADRLARLNSPRDRLALAVSLGFDFTAEEFNASKNVLSEEDLERIDGGVESPSCVPVAFFVSG